MSQTSTQKSSRSEAHNVRIDLKPDGGYGWIVCCGTFMVNFVVFGIHNSFGVVYVNLLDDLKLGEIQTGEVLNYTFFKILSFVELPTQSRALLLTEFYRA